MFASEELGGGAPDCRYGSKEFLMFVRMVNSLVEHRGRTLVVWLVAPQKKSPSYACVLGHCSDSGKSELAKEVASEVEIADGRAVLQCCRNCRSSQHGQAMVVRPICEVNQRGWASVAVGSKLGPLAKW